MNNATKKSLVEELDDIESFEQFAQFVSKLHTDFKENSGDWENENVGDAYESMAAWLRDSISCGKIDPANVPWRLFANILYAAKIYE